MENEKKILLRDILKLCNNVRISIYHDLCRETEPGMSLMPIYIQDCHEYDDLYNNQNILDLYLDHEGVDILANDAFSIDLIVCGEKVDYLIEDSKLEDKEKRYLESVFRPFRENIICVEKDELLECQFITYKVSLAAEDYSFETCSLPSFKKGTMFKRMELGRSYTLKELGLFEQEMV